MSRLRYENKQTGIVQIYEVIPNEFTSSGAPKRKYLGIEGPDGELIPSSGKRGRKPGYSPPLKSSEIEYQEQVDRLSAEIRQLKEQITVLEKIRSEHDELLRALDRIHTRFQLPSASEK